MSRRAPTFYVLHGDDEFSCRAQLQTMRAQMGDPSTAELNTTVLDGKNASSADVLSAARAMPFLSDRRLVIVEGMLSWLARKGAGQTGQTELAKLQEGLTDLPDSARLVFVEPGTLSERHPILKLAKTAPGGFHKTFNPLRDATAWIKQQSRQQYDTEIEHPAAMALANVTGQDLRAADSELAKLAAYVNGERPISEADVALLTPYVAEADIFQMVDALGRRDGATALRLFHRLLENDDPLRLFGMVIRQFRLLIQAREFLNDGGSPGQIGKAIGVHPFVGEKLAGQVRAFSLDQLEALYHFLLDTDVAIKTGKVDAVVGLDLLIAGVSS
ncbi:MAG: DNA polymerase III subunit delta [Anaerolineae bacterium]|nr:DNA polymerase III subunit delta [Anaerolineae bacterium]